MDQVGFDGHLERELNSTFPPSQTLEIDLPSLSQADALQSSAQIFDRHSPVPPSNARGVNEIEFLELDLPKTTTTVLNLAGLWGGERMAKNWVSKVAPNKETLKNKGSLHMSE